jgi:hypothetical protein
VLRIQIRIICRIRIWFGSVGLLIRIIPFFHETCNFENFSFKTLSFPSRCLLHTYCIFLEKHKNAHKVLQQSYDVHLKICQLTAWPSTVFGIDQSRIETPILICIKIDSVGLG